MGGHAKCLLLMTRGGGGVKKTQKPAYVIHGCSLGQKKVISVVIRLKDLVNVLLKVPLFESNKDRGNTVFKNEWTLRKQTLFSDPIFFRSFLTLRTQKKKSSVDLFWKLAWKTEQIITSNSQIGARNSKPTKNSTLLSLVRFFYESLTMLGCLLSLA